MATTPTVEDKPPREDTETLPFTLPRPIGDARIGIYPEDLNFCGECCLLTRDLCGLGLAFCFCIRPASRLCRISLVCFWTVLLTVTTVLVVKYGFYDSGTIRMSPTDELQVKRHISGFLCEELKMASGGPFNAYRFADEPQINASNTMRYDWKKTIFLNGKTMKSRDFYLLKGSVAKVKTCADNLMAFCVIKGESDFQRWRSQTNCLECCQEKIFVKERSCETLTVAASVSGRFYFVFNRAIDPTWVDVNIRLIRTTYDSDKAVESCVASDTCEFSLSYLSGETIVVQSLPTMGLDSVIRTTCVTRSSVYVLVFVIPAVVFACILIVYIHIKCKDTTRSTSRVMHRCRPPVIGYETFRYQTFTNPQPPGYEETSRTFSPPSYHDVVNSEAQ